MAKTTTTSDEVIVPETPVVEATLGAIDLPLALAAFKESVSASNNPFKSHMLLKVEEMARYI